MSSRRLSCLAGSFTETNVLGLDFEIIFWFGAARIQSVSFDSIFCYETVILLGGTVDPPFLFSMGHTFVVCIVCDGELKKLKIGNQLYKSCLN